MDYNDAALFTRVVELGSFTRTANALGLPKSSVSRAVARLEGDLGVRLLQRTTRQLGLTDAGQAFFDRVRHAVVGLEAAESTVRELGGEPRGVVRMTAPSDAHALGLAEALAEFVKKYPAIHVELTLTAKMLDLVAEGIDLALRAGRLTDSTLIARKIGSTAAKLFASPAYLRKRGRPKLLAELSEHDCVLFNARGGHATWELHGPRGVETVGVRGSISVDEMAFVARAAAAGMGIAIVPIALAGALAHRGELELVLREYGLEGGSLHVVLPSSVFIPARVALLRDFLVARLGKQLAELDAKCTKAKHAGT